MKKIKKRAQMSEFGWVFAVIVGIAILFLAAYFVGKMIKTEEFKGETELAKSFDIILEPFASIGGTGPISMSKTIKLSDETMIEFSCESNELGSQGLTLRTKSSFNKWGEWTNEMSINNKYIFSENLDGKDFYVLSKSFELPFRIEDLIYIISGDYCFVNAPDAIKEQFENMNVQKIKFDDCDGKRVCFESGEDCDIIVSGKQCEKEFFCDNAYEYGEVEKDDKTIEFATDALLYAAIFSDSDIYECNLNRLLNRLAILCEVYKEKADSMDTGCSVDDTADRINDLKDNIGGDMERLYLSAQEADEANSDANCQLY